MGQRGKACVLLLGGLLSASGPALARQPPPPPLRAPVPPSFPAVPPVDLEDRPLPINLPTALQLAHVRGVDIAIAAERIAAAAAVLDQAEVLWLPTITLGGDYNRHDGKIQDIQGNVFNVSRSSGMLGLGTGIGNAAVLNVNEALFAPLVARQQLAARHADLQVASNDTLAAVSDAYFNVQQARGDLAGAALTTARTEELVKRARQLAPAIVPELEVDRVETELARRQQAESLARERWKVSSAELLRILRLDATAQVEPVEPPHLRVGLIDLRQPVDDLVVFALTHRPELASQQAQVQATLALLRQEKLRPLIPSVLLRGFSTPVTGTLAAGYFGGGTNSSFGAGGLRNDLDLQVLWQLDNLGFGNKARVKQRHAENEVAVLQLFRLQDRIAAEVAQAYGQAQQAARRVEMAERGARHARASADKNLAALRETRTVEGKVQLLVRPQEAVAAVQALAQAYTDYYTAVADSNRAQFRLYRALGEPAQALSLAGGACLTPTAGAVAAPAPAQPGQLPGPAPGQDRLLPMPRPDGAPPEH